jgi:hypothetical protein
MSQLPDWQDASHRPQFTANVDIYSRVQRNYGLKNSMPGKRDQSGQHKQEAKQKLLRCDNERIKIVI